MQQHEIKIDWNDFIKPVVGYYTKDGKLYSMPYNSSTPILYYNKDAFKKAGLDPEKPPKTWKEVEAYSKKLIASGAAKCGFSTGWPSWTMVENMHATHDQPFATKNNGFDGVDGVELLINREFGVRSTSASSPPGRRTRSTPTAAGPAPPIRSSSAATARCTSSPRRSSAASRKRRASSTGARASCRTGGRRTRRRRRSSAAPRSGCMKGKPAAEYRGVAQFLEFLSEARAADVVAREHRLSRHLEHRRASKLEQGYHFVQQPQAVHGVRPAHGPAAHAARGPAGQEGGAGQARARGHREQPGHPARATSSRSATPSRASWRTSSAARRPAKQGLDDAVAKRNALLKEFAAHEQAVAARERRRA